jgi:hypothetical protein
MCMATLDRLTMLATIPVVTGDLTPVMEDSMVAMADSTVVTADLMAADTTSVCARHPLERVGH